MNTEQQRRQTIGRGLRLCVNQNGERLRGFEINTLTVIATEGYEEFAENLQKEIEDETGIKFGIVEKHQFAGISVAGTDGTFAPLGFQQSEALWKHLKTENLVDAKGKIQDELRTQLKNGTLQLPAVYQPLLPQIGQILKKLAGRLEIKNADERKTVRIRKEVLLGEEFQALWSRIKQKTTYRVEFDNTALLLVCTKALTNAPPIPRANLIWRKADLAIGESGVTANETATTAPVAMDEGDIDLPDIITELQNRTQLTRRSIVSILTGSGRLEDFKLNPQHFIDVAAQSINRAKRLAIVDGIKYQRLGDEAYYAQELFENEELSGYLKSMVNSGKSVHEQVVFDSETERRFAENLEKNTAVKVFAKLPGWYKIPTPLGPYNPDWAVLVNQDGEERLYFVIETKSSLFTDDLRAKEYHKIKCGEAHFDELGKSSKNPAHFKKSTDKMEFLNS